MPICPFCNKVVTTTGPRRYLRNHKDWQGRVCAGTGLSPEGAQEYMKTVADIWPELQTKEQTMPMSDPKVGQSEKFSDHFTEGERFYLKSIRTVKVNTADYGEGVMVLLTVEGIEAELGIWGKYLAAQAEAADATDLNKWYVVNRRMVPGFGNRPVKVLDPYAAPGQDDDDPGF